MPEHRIQRISVSENGGRIRAEAVVSLGGESRTLATEEASAPGESVTVTQDRAIAALRKALYAAGVPKRAIATAVKNIERN